MPKLEPDEMFIMKEPCTLVRGWQGYMSFLIITDRRAIVCPLGSRLRWISRVFIPWRAIPKPFSIPWRNVSRVENRGHGRILRSLRTIAFITDLASLEEVVLKNVGNAGPLLAAANYQVEKASPSGRAQPERDEP